MKSNKPLVSVLITSYNYGRYLKEAIDSALQQTYPHIEVIVVDDGSTDNSHDIIASYQTQITPIFQENRGQAAAVNSGFAIAQGEIICFLDADDVWLPTKVEQVVNTMLHNPAIVIAYHKVQNVDKKGQAFGKPWPPYKAIKGKISHKVIQTGGWWPWPPSSALSFTRPFLNQIMDIPEQEYKYFADAYPADLAPFFGEVAGIDQALSYFRLHDANNWSNPIGRDQRSLAELEIRTKVLNSILQKKKIGASVSLENHLPYQHISYKMGVNQNLMMLSQLMMQSPWEPRLHPKLKAIVKLWLDSRILLPK